MENIVEEVWVQVKDYPVYQISNHGRVKSFKNGKITILKGNAMKGGYIGTTLLFEGKVRKARHHSLVAEHYIDNPLCKPFVNHKDGNKRNNLYTNLEWCTASENNQHAYDTGLKNRADCGRSGLSHAGRRPIVKMDMDGNFIEEFISIKAAGYKNAHRITYCCDGKKDSYCGFKWAWKEKSDF